MSVTKPSDMGSSAGFADVKKREVSMVIKLTPEVLLYNFPFGVHELKTELTVLILTDSLSVM